MAGDKDRSGKWYYCYRVLIFPDQVPVVQKLDSAIHQINHYPVVSVRNTDCTIQQIGINLEDNAIQQLNNWNQINIFWDPQILMAIRQHS